MKIPITKTVLGDEEVAAVEQPIRSGWVVQGPNVAKFESMFSAYTNSKHSVATTSCTTALHIALTAIGIEPDDEVIVPAFTWIATANVVEYMRAKPVFCDVDSKTFNIDVNKIEACITDKTKAIIPVHLFGLCADMDPILDIAKKHNLAVVEDAACSFAAYYKGKHSGLFGDYGCFSFHPRKAITTGEGGMITSQSDESDELCRILRDHGSQKSDLERHENKYAFLLASFNHLGYNFRMTDIQGAIGVEQMKKADSIQSRRAARAARYNELLREIPELRLPFSHEDYQHSYQSYVCFYKSDEYRADNLAELHEERNKFMLKLEEAGISTRQGTHAVTNQNVYIKKYDLNPSDYPEALASEKLSICLPLYAEMTDEEQDYVVAKIKEYIGG